MLKQRIVCLLMALLALLALAACAPSGGQEIPVGGAAEAESAAGDALSAAGEAQSAEQPAGADAVAVELPITGTVEAFPATPDGQVVDVPPMSDAELAAQPPGQSEGGAGMDDSTQSEPGGPDASMPSADWLIYSDASFGFNVAHPSNFIVRQADAARLTGLIPTPSAAIYFMNPTTAESALAGTDAPDLEVRIFETGAIASLADWLASVGVGGDQSITATQLGSLPAVEVCGSTMIVPNCTTFVAGNNRVYQLRVLNLEGEAMAGSFTLAQ